MANRDEIRKYINLLESSMVLEASDAEQYTNRVQAPEGFTKEEGHGTISSGGHVDTMSHRGEPLGDEMRYVKIESDDIHIYFGLTVDNEKNIMVDGHTSFNTPTGWKTYSRRGIGDSFNVSTSKFDEYQLSDDPAIIIKAQIEKAETSIAKYQDSVVVPGLPRSFTVSPQQKEMITKKLQSGKAYTFAPGGMGQGYSLSTWRPHEKMGPDFDPSPEAPKELADFFGVPKLFVTSQDFD